MMLFVVAVSCRPIETSTFGGPRSWIAGRLRISALGPDGQDVEWEQDEAELVGAYVERRVVQHIARVVDDVTWVVE